MLGLTLEVACIVLACCSRRVPRADEQAPAEWDQSAAQAFRRVPCEPSKALRAILLAGTPVASYASTGPGVQFATFTSRSSTALRSVVLEGQRRPGQRVQVLRMDGDSRSKAEILERYLQTRAVVPETAPLPDDEIELLVLAAEKQAAPVKFDEERISGDWQLVWQKNTKSAKNSQKAAASLPQYSNFITDEKGKKVFRNIVQVTKNRVSVIADVEYEAPSPENKNPENRLISTIGSSTLQTKLGRRFGWNPLRVPLPIKGTGWLDITYLSNNMRISRGNLGSVFVHLRPNLLTKEAAMALTKT